MIVIDSNPKQQTYVDLLDLAFDICDEFHLVLRNDMGPLHSFEPVLMKLEGSFKEMTEQSEWASTILGDNQTAKVYFYYADANAKNVLKELSNFLYEWVMPYLPEDLSFFKSRKKWLITCSHEKESFINTEDKEEIERVLNIRGLQAHIGEF